MKKRVFLLLTSLILLLAGCTSEKSSNDIENENIKNDKIKVTASTYPMYYVANEIGKDKIDLNLLVPAGVDPHEYEVSLKEIKDLEQIDLFIYNGSGMESWGEKISNNLKNKDKDIINGSDYVELLNIEESEEHEEHEHDHGEKDPHIWLNPLNLDKIGKKVKEELIKLDKENQEVYEKNYLELSEKLKSLDNKYTETLKNKKDNTILVSHEAFGYLANRYGLEQIAVTGITPNSEPSPKTLAKLINVSKEKNIKYIFFEVLTSPKSVEMLAKEAKLEVLVLNPIGGVTKEQFDKGIDYVDLMEENLANLKKALVD
ncbi:ABC transporter zinc-binding lipoprotein ZnuA [Gottschalkia acidurici 9a]|uniref:ABC transporter zinc-binding lipoprotein ZnuA n=1 Tax=Gottschalkia acidurici (strain ATCC 7906 / DSM 604 / BCRC 14475 / CIP 104303 / KCTC 5404 / NCIMB 10678 / 9a) TaxID=1128398 RepID=K0AVT0_GOTA9|nr:zinc ABC transporter substrate-binding protein [Gottschalkia acidurici]AFS77963.1 ABC transporter zinc-binding lipoprotein ZnuA [Gottschalkia acidurici 9a]